MEPLMSRAKENKQKNGASPDMEDKTRNGIAERKGPKSCIARFLAWDGCLMMCSSVGVLVGFALGFALHFAKVSDGAIVWIGMPGELYLRMLKAAILPLVVSSIITGTAGLKPRENGRVSAVSLGYIIVTNLIGAVVGTVMAVILQPGSSVVTVDNSGATVSTQNLETSDLFADLMRNMVPDNVVTATFQKALTRYREVGVGDQTLNGTVSFQRYLSAASSTNFLGLVTVCAVVGMAAAKVGSDSKPVLDFFHSLSSISIRLVNWLVLFTPLGAASLIAQAIARLADIEATFRGLGVYVGAYMSALGVHLFVCLPLICILLLRRNPVPVFLMSMRAALTGGSVPSSLVAMPEIIICLERRHQVDERVSRFVAAMTVNLNRDGSVIFIATTCIYMAQIHGPVTADTVILNIVLAAVGSLAIPVVPSGSIVTVLMIAASFGVPPANIGILLALEWFSDRVRTFTNVHSHVLCGVITWRYCKYQVSGMADVNDLCEVKATSPQAMTLDVAEDVPIMKHERSLKHDDKNGLNGGQTKL